MLLAIDAGNTNIVFALHDGQSFLQKWRISSTDQRTADEYMVWLTQLMRLENLSPKDVDGAIIATVVPQTLFPLQLLCRRYFNVEAMVVGDPNIELGVQIKLDNPKEVGADRLVNAIAAHERYGGPLVIIDFGTATTFDVVDRDGSYLGGVIAPGVNLSVEALHMAAAKLPRVAVEKPAKIIGTSTVAAIQSGIYYGYAAMIDGMLMRIRQEYGTDMKIIATGGLAPLFKDEVSKIEIVDQELTTRGLFQIYHNNIAKAD
ncbi:MAG: pantothenate kinase [Kordiimonas sp.]|nr:pantothenate kinase [Kordiimonas sp.]|tara:strand:+ start:9461 stop:10240 length:780 start_codon:yes stop_codon:yes gene_type:complete